VRVRRETQNSPVSFHDFFYQVERVGTGGTVSYELMHLPVDQEGRSLITQDVLAVQPTGLILPNNRTGPSCDLFGDDDRTLPDDTGRNGEKFLGIDMQGWSRGAGGGGDSPLPPVPPEQNDGLDDPLPALDRFPPGPLSPGSALVMPENPCGEGNPPPVWRWMRGDAPLRGHTKRYQVIGTAEIQVGNGPPLRGEYRCGNDGWNPLIDETSFLNNLPPGREVELLWRAVIRQYGFASGGISGWWPSGTYFYKVTIEEYTNFAGTLSTDDKVYRVDPDGSINYVTRGADADFWVEKSRYRDNGGPWVELHDYSQFL
jgi:hypothetical protein